MNEKEMKNSVCLW